ncbi:ADP-ribosylglycohydrolase family protein [Bacteroidota bacterium]
MKAGIQMMICACLIFGSCNQTKQGSEINQEDTPLISLMVWDDKAKEGSDPAEFRLYQTENMITKIKIHYTVSGTARNGYDYTPVKNSITIKNGTPLKVFPIDDTLLEEDEMVTITLIDNPAYRVDPDNSSKTLVIQDNEIPDVQFLQPSGQGVESISEPLIEIGLSKPGSSDITVDYHVKGILAESDKDFKLKSGELKIPAGSEKVTLPFSVINDDMAEDDGTVIIELVETSGANIGLNERYFYTIINDDGEPQRSIIHDKIYGVLLGTRAASSMGAIVEMVVDPDQIEEIYGVFDELITYQHYNIPWSHPAGATEDGVERQKLMCTSIIEKQDRINADDLSETWLKYCELEEMYNMTQPYDRILLSYTNWGVPLNEFPRTRFGMPYDLGEHIHLTARVFHALPCINAGDPEGVIEDMNEIGRLYYENKQDDAFAWGAVYNAALSLAMLPGATVESVIEDALKYASSEVRKEIEHGLALADKYEDPMDKEFRMDLYHMYGDRESPYYASDRIREYPQSSIYENVTCSFSIFKATRGNVEQSVIIAVNRGRDTDCTAASAAGLAGAFSGTSTIPEEWIELLDEGCANNPYTNSHMTNKATADALYRALQNKLLRMQEEIDKMDGSSDEKSQQAMQKNKDYIDLMISLGVI